MPLAREIFETPHGRAPKWVLNLMLTAYVDESCHDRKDIAIVAGFLGNKQQWEKCEEEWRVGLGPRKHLHMNKLRWTKERRVSNLLSRLGPIPDRCGLTPLMSAVRVADYDDLIDGTRMQKLMKGYFICILGIVDVVMKHIPAEETFKLILENQHEYARGVMQTHKGSSQTTPDGRRKWTSVEFVEKEDTLLTEPGDFLAYALLQQYRDMRATRYRLCSPILESAQQPALVRNHLQPGAKDILRTYVKDMIKRFPNLMRSAGGSS